MIILATTVTGCTWKNSAAPSNIVILVENLGFGSFSCNEGDSGRQQGFQTFCDESVRFTHAYTPSVLSQATVASILTSKFPYEHGVRTNGAQSLSAKEETLAEKAWARGYKTAFFTGGPPIWRRSGLSQGFEIFDDAVQVGLKSLYRTAPKTVSLFLNWVDFEGPREKIFSFLYFPDLQFIDAPTVNELGEVRESSYRSQIDEVDLALSTLVKEMKRRKIWDQSNVFLVGLQGYASEPRGDELPSSNLFSESTRATLMIKPARVNRNGPSAPFNWKIDANVSLVDVGSTLLDLMGALPADEKPKLTADGFEIGARTLKSALNGPKPDWPLDRFVISESAWTQWRGIGTVRAAIRQGPYLFVYDQNAQLFDTLTDNLESTRLPRSDATGASLRSELSDFLQTIGFTPWVPPSKAIVDRLVLGHELWREREPTLETLQRLRALAKRHAEDSQLGAWRAIWALRVNNWVELKAAAVAASQPLWGYVAARNLGEKTPPPEDPCFDFVQGPLGTRPLPKACHQEALADLLTWANDTQPETTRAKAQDAFMRVYAARALATRVAEHNQVAGLRWDSGAMSEGPDTMDLILALPEMRKVRALARDRSRLR